VTDHPRSAAIQIAIRWCAHPISLVREEISSDTQYSEQPNKAEAKQRDHDKTQANYNGQ
jgi:hypothetical protein